MITIYTHAAVTSSPRRKGLRKTVRVRAHYRAPPRSR